MSRHPTTDIDSLLALIRELLGEVYPGWKDLHFSADTDLERELGLDSLARIELRERIEARHGIRLDDSTAINAGSASALLQAISAQTHGTPATPVHTGKQQASDLLMGPFASRQSAAASPPSVRHTPGEWLYAFYAWTVFLLLGLLTWLAVVLAPCESWRQRLAKTGARLFFKCTFIPLTVTGLEHLDPKASHILVANHASYLDGFIVTAALNIPIHFIVKGELAGIWPARVLLQRFGVEFVDRFNANAGNSDLQRIVEKSRAGQSIVFFPEGTFTDFAGLQPFRMGAFVTAARSQRPIIPLAIAGARTIQTGNHSFVHHGRIHVTVCPPVVPAGKGWPVALQLRDAARLEISQFCGEPDLVAHSQNVASGDE